MFLGGIHRNPCNVEVQGDRAGDLNVQGVHATRRQSWGAHAWGSGDPGSTRGTGEAGAAEVVGMGVADGDACFGVGTGLAVGCLEGAACRCTMEVSGLH